MYEPYLQPDEAASLIVVRLRWQPVAGEKPRSTRQHFESIEDAVIYCMEVVQPRLRATAWIKTEKRPIKFEEMVLIYDQLKGLIQT